MKHPRTIPNPNPKDGALTISEYELVEFDMTLSGQQSVCNAIIRSSAVHYRQATTLPKQIAVAPRPYRPTYARPARESDRGLVVIILVAMIVFACVMGAFID